ncbi:MAG TPA: hypothetical protein VKI45_11085, partial [Allosphingosinicella sp.]|nr:hypothetical protein [Allosphingosinicella sp.]
MRRLGALAMMLAASACVSQQPAAAPPVRRVQAPPPPAEVHYSPQGLENVIGRTAAYLAAELGEPDLDIREGTARKLQFSRP